MRRVDQVIVPLVGVLLCLFSVICCSPPSNQRKGIIPNRPLTPNEMEFDAEELAMIRAARANQEAKPNKGSRPIIKPAQPDITLNQPFHDAFVVVANGCYFGFDWGASSKGAFASSPEAQFAGVIADDGGVPIANQALAFAFRNAQGIFHERGQTDAQGRFTINGPRGTLRMCMSLLVAADQSREAVLQYTEASLRALQERRFAVGDKDIRVVLSKREAALAPSRLRFDFSIDPSFRTSGGSNPSAALSKDHQHRIVGEITPLVSVEGRLVPKYLGVQPIDMSKQAQVFFFDAGVYDLRLETRFDGHPFAARVRVKVQRSGELQAVPVALRPLRRVELEMIGLAADAKFNTTTYLAEDQLNIALSDLGASLLVDGRVPSWIAMREEPSEKLALYLLEGEHEFRLINGTHIFGDDNSFKAMVAKDTSKITIEGLKPAPQQLEFRGVPEGLQVMLRSLDYPIAFELSRSGDGVWKAAGLTEGRWSIDVSDGKTIQVIVNDSESLQRVAYAQSSTD